jgi:hypothetical protein
MRSNLQEVRKFQKTAGLLENYNVSEDDAQILNMLIHDKEHVSDYNNELNKIIKSNLEKFNGSLYRGFGKNYNLGDISKNPEIGQIFKIGDVISLSENIKIAKTFGKSTKIIMELINPIGFCYWKWYENWMQEGIESGEEDEESAKYLIKMARKEKEWLISQESKFKVLSIKPEENYTIISCTQV